MALVIPTMDEVVDPEVVCYTCALTGELKHLISHCDAIVRAEGQMPDFSFLLPC